MTTEQAVANLMLSEVGIGSMLHAAHVPFGGHLLSLNQIFLLTRLSISQPSFAASTATLKCSLMAASLKALSPMGKRLTPMLAIATQGILFSLGLTLHSNNFLRAATFVGGTLAGAWAVLQPLLVARLVFGQQFFTGIQRVLDWITHFIHLSPIEWWWLWSGFLLLKIALSVVVVHLAWHSPLSIARYENWLTKVKAVVPTPLSRDPASPLPARPLRFLETLPLALREFFRPQFLLWLTLGIVLSSTLLYFGEDPQAFSQQDTLLLILRPVGISILALWIGFWIKEKVGKTSVK